MKKTLLLLSALMITQAYAQSKITKETVPCVFGNYVFTNMREHIYHITKLMGIELDIKKKMAIKQAQAKKMEQNPNAGDEVFDELVAQAKTGDILKMPKEELAEKLVMLDDIFFIKPIQASEYLKIPDGSSVDGCYQMTAKQREEYVQLVSKLAEKYEDGMAQIVNKLNEQYQFPPVKQATFVEVCPINDNLAKCIRQNHKKFIQWHLENVGKPGYGTPSYKY